MLKKIIAAFVAAIVLGAAMAVAEHQPTTASYEAAIGQSLYETASR